jgi:hypothetical protein
MRNSSVASQTLTPQFLYLTIKKERTGEETNLFFYYRTMADKQTEFETVGTRSPHLYEVLGTPRNTINLDICKFS